ncbi:MAG TPA: HlyD family efflux transporter periplasmic adaptor subunit, partial [Thermoanaerobaculia bacterium]|nr:HlyD family efflux transporter periplasmic adaptor subunit [Thermoanaerobaculia bacterium]
MKLSPKRLILILSLLGVVAFAGMALRPRPVTIETARAARGPLRVTVDEEGETRVRHRYILAAPVAGRLERIALDEGDAVTVGQVVVRLDPAPLDSRGREQAEARLASARAAEREAEARVAHERAAVAEARRRLARAERLGAEKIIPAEELDAARTTVRTAESDLEAASFRARAAAYDVESARAALLESRPGGPAGGQAIELRSPVAGSVLRVCQECEKVVEAGAELIELGDPGDLEVVVDVLSTDAVKIRPGAPMWLDAGAESGEELQARVRTIEPSGFTKVSPLGVEEQRVNVIADLVDPPGRLGDRYRVEARIVLWEEKNVLKIPAGALFRT